MLILMCLRSFVTSILGLTFLGILLLGCGSSSLLIAQKGCLKDVERLKRRVGPEFSQLVSSIVLPLEQSERYGCAYIFMRVSEEMPGEVVGEYSMQKSSEELAFLLPSPNGEPAITFPTRPSYRREAVKLKVSLVALIGENPPEIIVEERARVNLNRSKALRIFMYADGIPAPREILSTPLKIKSLPATWEFVKSEGPPSIMQQAGGKKRLFVWDKSLQRYQPQSDESPLN